MYFGLETEYGIHVDGKTASDMMEEARAVVRAYRGKSAGPWNYAAESPRHDMRGFDVERLSRDTADAQFDAGSRRYSSATEERADRVLTNGARLYNDHGHPEYATPECRDLLDLVAHDRAGERILFQCAMERAKAGAAVTLYKNNTDFHGASYGCHEGYLTRRDIPFQELQAAMVPFLVTRQAIAGAGKVGVEPEAAGACYFQLSQRADYVTEIASVDTLARRPIFNTRDEAHADPRKYRRLHVIVGDANMSEVSTALKVGSTALTLKLLETGWRPRLALRDPVRAVKEISRDQRRQWLVEMDGRPAMRATDIQRVYCEEAERELGGSAAGLDFALKEWRRTLDLLDCDPMSLSDRLDWVAKYQLLNAFREEEDLEWSDPMLQSLDLAYSDVDPEVGLYHGLEQDGHAVRLTDDAMVQRAMTEPPTDTRAAVRGALVDQFSEKITGLSWSTVALRGDKAPVLLEIPILGPEASRLDAEAVRNAGSVEELGSGA
jgi:proteasome accessory factor A